MATTKMASKRHRWKPVSSSDGSRSLCEKCGLRRVKGYGDDSCFSYYGHDRDWERYAPPCPPEANAD
jgi:hypothetical protein